MSDDSVSKQRNTPHEGHSLACQTFFARTDMRGRGSEGARDVYNGEKYLSTKGPPSIKGKDRGNKQQQFTRRKLSDSVAEGNNQGRTRKGHNNHLRDWRQVHKPCPGQQELQQNCPEIHLELPSWIRICGLYLLLWGFLMNRDALRGSRDIVGSPFVSFRRISSRDTKNHIRSFKLDARELPADQPPHLQHPSVASRKPNWCEKSTELSPNGSSS